MRSNFLRFAIILGVILIAYTSLKPTYRWYFALSDQEKSLANTTKQEYKSLTNKIESQVLFLREAIKNDEAYKVALNPKDQEKHRFALDISVENKDYKADIDSSLLVKLVQKMNPSFKDSKSLTKTYKALQANLQKIKDIHSYKAIKSHVINLGLDIAGGVHFALGVDKEKLHKALTKRHQEEIRPAVVRQSVLNRNPKLSGKELDKAVSKEIQDLKNNFDKNKESEEKDGVNQALIKITNRIDQFGVSEPSLIKGPNNTILIDLPGKKDTESAKEIFTRVGTLSFQMVNEDFLNKVPLFKKNRSGYIVDPSSIDPKTVPNDTEILFVQGIDKFGQPINIGALAVYKKVDLSGDHVQNAKVEHTQLGEPSISFRLDTKGANIFGDLTRKNTNKRLAIVLDNKIQSAPNIREPILTGSGSISGSFTQKESALLSTILKSGSLPIPLKIEEERLVGPTLGETEIYRGMLASVISLVVLCVFLFVYYGLWGGLSANIAQVLNLFFILSIMSQINATLTLPGIVAIVLTIGMSVDANVILHERIKEDLRSGYSLVNAIESGYQSAFTTILDSNLTTFIPGLILSIIGNGAVRGFGVTLMIGLLVNLFTSIFVSRSIFNLLTDTFKVKTMLWSKKYGK